MFWVRLKAGVINREGEVGLSENGLRVFGFILFGLILLGLEVVEFTERSWLWVKLRGIIFPNSSQSSVGPRWASNSMFLMTLCWINKFGDFSTMKAHC